MRVWTLLICCLLKIEWHVVIECFLFVKIKIIWRTCSKLSDIYFAEEKIVVARKLCLSFITITQLTDMVIFLSLTHSIEFHSIWFHVNAKLIESQTYIVHANYTLFSATQVTNCITLSNVVNDPIVHIDFRIELSSNEESMKEEKDEKTEEGRMEQSNTIVTRISLSCNFFVSPHYLADYNSHYSSIIYLFIYISFLCLQRSNFSDKKIYKSTTCVMCVVRIWYFCTIRSRAQVCQIKFEKYIQTNASATLDCFYFFHGIPCDDLGKV